MKENYLYLKRRSALLIKSLIARLIMFFKRWFTVILLVLSIGATVASHTLGAVGQAFAGVLTWVGVSSIIEDLSTDVKRLKLSNKNLIDDLDDARKKSTDLKIKNKALGRRVKKMDAITSEMKSNINQFKNKATRIIDRIRRRTAKAVTLNVGSMSLESIPFLGVATIVTVTSAEVYAACEDMKDLGRLQDLYDPQPKHEERSEVCGIELPVEKELKVGWGEKKGEIWGAFRGWWDHVF
ncbi:MAG: hypothetical protein HOI31_04390 [Gammaproteobacteria bacterium]|jgi:hypothetical protein|nr:hypothetical protein [Thiotrichales bacterium]MBT5466224.1 hypothetical protein [Candidatus Neomarinimicrobiota bacterium]MBT5745515.1 hypothetical protein [Gammaproteobacteria bacterium]MBT7830906.1 hypothetical protein [Candidatus Neomarinimicrobiota bacterium]